MGASVRITPPQVPHAVPGTPLGQTSEPLGKEQGYPGPVLSATCPPPLEGVLPELSGPAAPLGGGQACAWVAVSLAGPHFPLYLVPGASLEHSL